MLTSLLSSVLLCSRCCCCRCRDLNRARERWVEMADLPSRQEIFPTYVLFTTFRGQVAGATPSMRDEKRAMAERPSALERTPVVMTLPLQGKTMKDTTCRCRDRLRDVGGGSLQPLTVDSLSNFST